MGYTILKHQFRHLVYDLGSKYDMDCIHMYILRARTHTCTPGRTDGTVTVSAALSLALEFGIKLFGMKCAVGQSEVRPATLSEALKR